MSRSRREAHQADGIRRQLGDIPDATAPCTQCEPTSRRGESGVVRDTDGRILRGPSLPCGCPLDAGCSGYHN
jgi:hypothetical protein